MDIDEIDHTTREHLEHLQALLYSSCTGLKDSRLNVSSKLTWSAIIITSKRLHQKLPSRCVWRNAWAGITTADMLAWSVALSEAATPPALEHERNEKKPGAHHFKQGHGCTTHSLYSNLKLYKKRLKWRKHKPCQITNQSPSAGKAGYRPRYGWYTRIPRVWDSADRHKKSESRHIVAFMKLFLDDGFVLNPKATNYKDDVLCVGQQAESSLPGCLQMRGTKEPEVCYAHCVLFTNLEHSTAKL
ncbi:LOW QUALITY PROTEIN: hypothetical protein PHMEG_00041922 [Phytophthora megakarya]|uniref:Uncharacterized protein n=1 Tax=Phytophthora megakarya TaxID=4795 RepID=A0A225UAX4_9STRA|nr:LOW QUALITY PROTEIN: hypothetical protein PHMEG_00041922 [Phytophthora megakarya]